ncbi:AraC family transcriptional regulator [Gelidibacter japonicus]|jgi:AraC-like DNA-binding protein|uniref:AraC family transcriptional regulator n=1 Tax=Gelidibacter japonicus TaxID=1962232 RepID=UPI00201FBB12|nr:AraC family transcriptional regulator [Gelidibacter japonicus]MCL8006929.1 AraC family transcriptional regulator [Gelidibacter japonicus]
MKVLPFKIPKPEHYALVYQEDIGTSFYDQLHQHEEIQLSYIIEGEGKLIVGDTINFYKPDDILVIGSHLPHLLKSDTSVGGKSKMLSLFFSKKAFGKRFFEMEETKALQSFFTRATHGFKVVSEKEAMIQLFLRLKTSQKLDQFLILLELLKLASTCEYKSLSSFIYDKQYSDYEGNRMRNIFEFTMSNFNTNITLEAVSEKANMTKNAFCKYFKKRTNKTYFQFLTELRVEHATKLLLSKNKLTVAEIAYESGFKNISNFNRQFKDIKKSTPSDFRKKRV